MFTRQIVLCFIVGILSIFTYFVSDLSARKDVVNASSPLFDSYEAIKIEIEVDQDKLENLYALLPKQPVCEKIRQKYINANSLKINGQIIFGKNRLRVRGYCSTHWSSSQKSLKVKLGQKFHNTSTLNLNAWATDPAGFDLYASKLQEANGAAAVRVRIAHLYINGEFDGARFLSENIDDDFIGSRKIEKSVIYREKTHAPIGLKPNLVPYGDVSDLKHYWQKNTANSSDWSDFLRFNSAVYQSSVHGSDVWKSEVNLEAYATHEAVISILGTNHLNDHNIPMFRRLSRRQFEPIGYDYAGSYTSQYSMRLPNVSEQSLYITQNWLSSLLWKDPETRSSIQGIIYRNLVSDLPSQILVKSKAYMLEHVKGTPQAAVFESNLPFLEQLIRNRLAYLVANYLEPRFIFQNQNQNQLNGGALLAQVARPFTIQQASTSLPHCSGEGAVAFVTWEGQRRVYLECRNGQTFPKKVTITPKVISDRQIADQHDILNGANMLRASIGGTLLQFDSSIDTNIQPIADVLGVNTPIRQVNGWPLNFKRLHSGGLDVVSDVEAGSRDSYLDFNEIIPILTENADPNLKVKNGRLLLDGFYENSNLVNPYLRYSFEEGVVNVLAYGPLPWQHWRKVNPILCANVNAEKVCYELTVHDLFSREQIDKMWGKDKIGGHLGKIVTISQKDIDGCNHFQIGNQDFTTLITEPLIFDKDCALELSAGKIKLYESAFIVFPEYVKFSDLGKTLFSAYGIQWGGLIFNKLREGSTVTNLEIRQSSEFEYDGRGFVAGLTIRDGVNVKVSGNKFDDIHSDDALNIVNCTNCSVSLNSFTRNRDGLDIDFSNQVQISNNIFQDNVDDAIDIGSSVNIVITNNEIIGSGDKGVSIGPESYVKMYKNLVANNSIGIAVKDNSKLTSEDFIQNNKVGLASYNKILYGKSAVNQNKISGKLDMSGNGVPFRFDGQDFYRSPFLDLSVGKN